MKFLLLTLSVLLNPAAFACEGQWAEQLKDFKAVGDPERRSAAGVCLVKNHLGETPVAKQILRTISDGKEDIFLREDLIHALAATPLRKRVRVNQALMPELAKKDLEAAGRVASGTEGLFALGQAVKAMDEIVPVTRYERDFFRTLSELVLEDSNSAVLRAAAVEAMEKLARSAVESGFYDMRNVRLVQETLSVVAARDDNASYFSGAASAYGRLAEAGLPNFTGRGQRAIASEKSKAQ